MATMLKAVAVCMLVLATFTIAEQPDEIVPEFVEFLHDSGDTDVEEIQESSPKTSRAGSLNDTHQMLDNIRDLISYSKAVRGKAMELQGESVSVTHSVILNSLVKYASVNPKDMVIQYAKYTGDLKKFFDKGLSEYILSHLNKAILHGEGVVSIKKVGISGATKAILNHEALGLRAEPRLLRRLAASVSDYQAAEAAVTAGSGNADNLAAMECLKTGQMKQYKTFLERVKEKYKQQAEDEYAKIFAAADKSEVAAFNKHKKVHVEAPAGMSGAKDEVRKLSEVALHTNGKSQPSVREMMEEAKQMAAEWARGNVAACSNTVAVVTKIEQGQKSSPNCDAIAGEYKLGVKLTVKKGAIKGVYKSQRLLNEPLSGGVEKETKTECTGSATGHLISVQGGAATATFKFNKKTKVITWSTGETWTQGKSVKKKPPAPKPKAPYVLKIAVTTGTKPYAESKQKPSVTIVGTKGEFTGKITVGGKGAKKETTFKPSKDIGSVKSVTFDATSTDGWLLAKTEVKSGALGWQSVGCGEEWLDGKPYDADKYYSGVAYGDKLTLPLKADCKNPKKQFEPLTGSFKKGTFAKWATAAGAKLLEGDFNGDGKADMAITGPDGWSTIPVAFSNGDGTYRVENKKVGKFPGWAKTSGVQKVAGDFNGDGKTDIAMTGGKGWSTIPVAFSKGDGTFRVTNLRVKHFATWARTTKATLVAGDFNGDGKSDIAISGPSGWSTIPVATSDGKGGFSVTNHNPGSPWTKSWANSARHIVAGDFDGDGKADLALAGGHGWTTIPVATSTSGGRFKVTNHKVTKFPAWAQDKTMMVVGDFNGDKKADLALTGPAGWKTIPVAFSTGGGKFTVTNDRVASFPDWSAASGAQAVAGDFTGDGKCDISVLGAKDWTSAHMAKNTM